jgi:hypothetical protein
MNFDALKDKIVWAFLALLVAWLWVLTQRSLLQPNVTDVEKLIQQQGPYSQERPLIMERMAEMKSRETRMASEMDRTIREIYAMRIDLERLLTIKPADLLDSVKELQALVKRQIRDQRREERDAQKQGQ